MFEKLRSEVQPTFLCSAGDFYGGVNEYNEPKDHFIAKMMGRFDYDAIAVGERDLAFGMEKLVKDWKAYHLNLICANIFEKAGKSKRVYGRRNPKRVFPAYRIVRRNGLKIGFLAILSPRTKVKIKKPGENFRVEALTYTIEDPLPIAKKLIPIVRKKCDLLVLLAHMERNELEKMLPELHGVDMAVLGHSEKREYTEEPYMMGTVPVYKATFQGQVIGALKVTLDPGGKIADSRNNITVLDKGIKDNEEVAQEIAAFEKENRKRQKEIFAKRQLKASRAGGGGQDVYLGLGACIRCHKKDFEVYINTKHARAYSTLSKMFKHRDSDCIGCHSTGYGKRGGYDGNRNIGSMVDLIDVQCEACHGPGSEHTRDGKYAERALSSCKQCHNEQRDPTFDFSKEWLKIKH